MESTSELSKCELRQRHSWVKRTLNSLSHDLVCQDCGVHAQTNSYVAVYSKRTEMNTPKDQATGRTLNIRHEFGMITVTDANGKTCFCWHSYKENVELANMIVRKVNCHDELVEALKEIIEAYDYSKCGDYIENSTIDKAKQALKKAGEA